MCVIICIDDGKYPTIDTLKSAESLNSHGGSIAWLNKNGTRSYRKGIKATQIHNIIEKKLKPRHITTAIIHFRIASVGSVNKKLCHPFDCTRQSELRLSADNVKHDVLFHNGTWSDYAEVFFEQVSKRNDSFKLSGGEYSDSRIMAILSAMTGHHSKMAKLVTGWNKIAILTSKGIVKYGTGWITHDGNQCSNDYFIDKPKPKYASWITNYGSYGNYGNIDDEYNGITKRERERIEDIKKKYELQDWEVIDYLNCGYSVEDIEWALEEDDRKLKAQMQIDDEMKYLGWN